ncbi:MAG: tyrosine-type recombinase/integrase [Candidatus Bathyarchaeia archaeon]
MTKAEGKAGLPQAPKGATRQSESKNGKSAKPSRSHQPPIRCPECGSSRVWKDGLRYTRLGDVQRWLCRSCGLRFSESVFQQQVEVDIVGKGFKVFHSGPDMPKRQIERGDFSVKERPNQLSLVVREDVAPHDASLITKAGKYINTAIGKYVNRRVSAEEGEAKNLAAAIQGEKQAAGATLDTEAKLLEYAWWMKKQGYAESTILDRCRILKTLTRRGANLLDSESVKAVIARQSWSEGRKEFAVDAYTSFLSMMGLTWQPPRYRRIEKLPWVPTEAEIDQLIAGCSHKIGAFLQLIKETGMRPGEALRLKWIDIDPVNRTVNVTPEKGSNPRIFKVSASLMERLNALPRASTKVFGEAKFKTIQKNFQEQRKRVAAKLRNPRIQRICFLTLRHWKGTMEYHKTKDILHVMRLLGHKNIKNTLVYTHLVDFEADEYVSKAAWTLEEAQKLIEAGFEYVCDVEGAKLFRKRK